MTLEKKVFTVIFYVLLFLCVGFCACTSRLEEMANIQENDQVEFDVIDQTHMLIKAKVAVWVSYNPGDTILLNPGEFILKHIPARISRARPRNIQISVGIGDGYYDKYIF